MNNQLPQAKKWKNTKKKFVVMVIDADFGYMPPDLAPLGHLATFVGNDLDSVVDRFSSYDRHMVQELNNSI